MYERACDVGDEAVNITRELCRLHPGEYEAHLADRLLKYGISLQSCGMYQSACDAKAEAISIMRELCGHDPDKHDADLADCLRSYGISLHLGRCTRVLVMPMPRLSTSLANSSNVILADTVLTWRNSSDSYGVSLHSREMYRGACDAHAEAVNITRKLFQRDSGQHGADLAERL